MQFNTNKTIELKTKNWQNILTWPKFKALCSSTYRPIGLHTLQTVATKLSFYKTTPRLK